MDDIIDQYEEQKAVEKLEGILRGAAKKLAFDGQQVVKTIPVRPEWKAAFDELEGLTKQHDELHRRMESKRKLIWATIESELDEYRDMEYDDAVGEIKIYDDPADAPEKPRRKSKKPTT